MYPSNISSFLHFRRYLISFFVLLIMVTVPFLVGQHKPYQPARSSLNDPARKMRAAQITSSFENSSLSLQYDYAQDIGDGNGITAGRAGFTTGTGDLLEVVQSYTKLKPDNLLAKYIPTLQAVNGSKNTAGLEQLAVDWKLANKDPQLHAVQDAIVDKLYYIPAMQRASQVGIHTALGGLILWDTWIQQGSGDSKSGDPDGADQVIAETRQTMHGYIKNNEAAWLQTFLRVRRQHLYHQYESTINDRTSSDSRVTALNSFIDHRYFSLDLPLQWSVYGDNYQL